MNKGERQSLALLAAIVKLGGRDTKKRVLDVVDDLQLYHITEDSRKEKHNRPEPEWRNTLAYARFRLVNAGLMTADGKDEWGISETGLEYGQELSDRALRAPYPNEYEVNAARLFLLNAFGDVSDESALELGETRREGKPKEVWTTVYERNPRLRIDAIEYHGTVCKVCDFSFSDRYESIGAGFIEVHHLRPISSYKSEVSISVKYDLTVLCSNCHRMIHRRSERPFSVKELKHLLKR